MHRVFWQETIGVAAGDVIIVDRHQGFQLSNLVVSVEIRLSNLSMLLPMLSSMSASVTAFLMASFIHFWASSTTACSCSWLTHSLKPLGLLSPVCSPPAIVNTKIGTNGESYPYQMTTWLQWCHFSQQVEASYQALIKFLSMQAVDGTTDGQFMIPVR